VGRNTRTALGIGALNQVMKIPLRLKAIGAELGSAGCPEVDV
jgi:hypothetical protein